jgi:hypothetical protein
VTRPSSREHTDAIVAALTAGGLTAQAGRKPDDQPGLDHYVVVRPWLDRFDGPLADEHADAVLTYQVIAVGSTVEQAEWTRDQARGALLQPGAVTTPGRLVSRVAINGTRPTARDDDLTPPAYYAIDLIDIWTSPA